MKTTFTFLWILLGFYSIQAAEDDCRDCAEAHSSASYALFHTKKSLKADNFDHQKYYADRAIEAFEKTRGLIENCGCQDAINAVIDGTENLKKASDPEDWDKGRFYAKKAYADAQNLIGFLEMCTSGKRQTVFDDSEYISDSGTDDASKANEQKILDQQKRLQQQQQQLLEEQKKLEQELEAQRKLNEQRELERQKELQQQIKLKVKAEQALQNFEKSITELSEVLGCKEAYDIIFESYIRAEKALESESLQGTKRYYTEKARLIAKQAMNGLESCAFKN
ncbi:hypothetical protein GWK08_18545 [Leptobacterium flavescens]|uniref:Uncharacterized protein n=1 Tax=Leptobacterium flavescens TaxID=472055 RepID=A0A6P0USF7_9FLAO|nr:hypothetical protein [Leptobacterium flavescens]NER15460.1 hypothetical protein [Leptobacterium flavescens]